MKVKLLEPIDGYEEIAEFRYPKCGEFYATFNDSGKLQSIKKSEGLPLPQSHILKPKVKKYDWTKTQGHVLVRDYCAPHPLWTLPTTLEAIMLGSPCTKVNAVAEGVQLDYENWIPVLDGVCPFDAEACELYIMEMDGLVYDTLGCDSIIPWHKVKCASFIKLRDGYTW